MKELTRLNKPLEKTLIQYGELFSWQDLSTHRDNEGFDEAQHTHTGVGVRDRRYQLGILDSVSVNEGKQIRCSEGQVYNYRDENILSYIRATQIGKNRTHNKPHNLISPSPNPSHLFHLLTPCWYTWQLLVLTQLTINQQHIETWSFPKCGINGIDLTD